MQEVPEVIIYPPELGEDHPGRVAFEMARSQVYPWERIVDGRERDEHDKNASYITVRGNGIFGGCRLVRSPSPDFPLPAQVELHRVNLHGVAAKLRRHGGEAIELSRM